MPWLLCGDCLELMKDIPDKSIDLFFCDLPYNALPKQEWDKKIDLEKLWIQIRRLRKDSHTPIFFTTTTKYGVELIQSAPKDIPFRYDLVWAKSTSTGHLRSGSQPLRQHELIYVFYEHLPFYNKQKHKYLWAEKDKKPTKRKTTYGEVETTDLKTGKDNGKPRYEPPLPVSILEFKSTKTGRKHKTEKPISLIEWILDYYSKEGDTILDPTMGCGSTGEGCKNLNREFIGIELNKEFYETSISRLGL
eukprot:COSAG02_NODE_1023_length_15151_cov_745.123572_22_plen_248_part_00